MASVFVPSVPIRSPTTTGNTANTISNPISNSSITNPNLTIVAHGNDTNHIVRSSKIPTPASTSISTLSTISIETVAASTAVISQDHHACRRK